MPVPPMPDEFQRGQPITGHPFELLRRAVAWLLSKRIVSVRAPLVLQETPGGTVLGIEQKPLVVNAMTTTAISARSGTTKGNGKVTLYKDDTTGTGQDVVLQTNVEVYNPYTATIATGKWVVVALIDGTYQIIGSSC